MAPTAKIEDDASVSIPISRRSQTKVAAAGLDIMSHTSGAPVRLATRRLSTPSSSPTTSSPATPPSDSEDSWNLIPYDLSWGPDYANHLDTPPGPDGTCMFLRSPTPLKNRRAYQACTYCRERKAKCSGTRPSCERCFARGQDCRYTARRANSDRSWGIFNNDRCSTSIAESDSVISEPGSSVSDSFRGLSLSSPNTQPSSCDNVWPESSVSRMDHQPRFEYSTTTPTHPSQQSHLVHPSQQIRCPQTMHFLPKYSVNPPDGISQMGGMPFQADDPHTGNLSTFLPSYLPQFVGGYNATVPLSGESFYNSTDPCVDSTSSFQSVGDTYQNFPSFCDGSVCSSNDVFIGNTPYSYDINTSCGLGSNLG